MLDEKEASKSLVFSPCNLTIQYSCLSKCVMTYRCLLNVQL
jgi:hypothetical protein